MEKKLNPKWYWRRLWTKDNLCTITTAQYWDWLTYIDVRFPRTVNAGALGRLHYRMGGP